MGEEFHVKAESGSRNILSGHKKGDLSDFVLRNLRVLGGGEGRRRST